MWGKSISLSLPRSDSEKGRQVYEAQRRYNFFLCEAKGAEWGKCFFSLGIVGPSFFVLLHSFIFEMGYEKNNGSTALILFKKKLLEEAVMSDRVDLEGRVVYPNVTACTMAFCFVFIFPLDSHAHCLCYYIFVLIYLHP
jgi:hypothetical protein